MPMQNKTCVCTLTYRLPACLCLAELPCRDANILINHLATFAGFVYVLQIYMLVPLVLHIIPQDLKFMVVSTFPTEMVES
jgi:hypothetical protein